MATVSIRVRRTPIHAAKITAALRGDGVVFLDAGTYNITQPIYVPSNATLEGVGTRTEIRCSGDYPAIVFENADESRAQSARVANLKITRSNTSGAPALQGESDGIRILGDDIAVEGVSIEDCFRGIRLVEDVTPSERITIARCKITHANALANTSTYGIDCADVRSLTIRDCHVSGAWLDGIKLRKNTRDVLIAGGSSCENGVFGAGDGVDGYVGGDTFKMIGVLCADNTGNGAQIKTGPLTPADGYARKFEITGCTFRDNTNVGLTINTSTIDAPTNTGLDIMTAYARVIGCLFEDNGSYGLFVRGRNFEIVAPTCLSNGDYGLVAITDALDVTVQGGHYVGNANGGMYLTGQRITVVAPTCIGKEDPDIDNDADYAGVTATQPYGIVLASVCDDVVIENPRGHSNGTAYWSMQGDFTGKNVVINASGAVAPSIPGSTGSTYRRTDGGAGSSFYVKEAGPPQSTAGWAAK
jgi:hypothetical protein